jgi:hypothetical protein
MAQRTQISLPPEDHRRARARAAELGISLAENIRRLVEPAPVEALFALGSSGEGTDVATRKDEYLGEAVRARSARDR